MALTTAVFCEETNPVDASDGTLGTVEKAIDSLRQGRPVVVFDDAGRENEGDLVLPAEFATTEALAFVIRHTSGVVCVALPGERLDELDVPLMVATSSEKMGTAFTVSVDYLTGTTTGISAADRAATVRALVDPQSKPQHFARPGHVFPLRYRPGGVFERPGHTEAAIDLMALSGLRPGAVLAELVNEDGTMARDADLTAFAVRHGLVMITVEQVVGYRWRQERMVEASAAAKLPTRHGSFMVHAYRSRLDGTEHLALVHGQIEGSDTFLVGLHRECVSGDLFGTASCWCGSQLRSTLQRMADAPAAVLIYLRGDEGHGANLGHPPSPPSAARRQARSHGIAAAILADLGVKAVRLVTADPAEHLALLSYGVEVVERLPPAVRTPRITGSPETAILGCL